MADNGVTSTGQVFYPHMHPMNYSEWWFTDTEILYRDGWELICTVKNHYCMKLMEWHLTAKEWQSDSISVAV